MSKLASEERYIPALAYDWLTPAYDAVVRYTTRERTFKAALLDEAGLRNDHRVLDLACGTGTLTVAAKERVPGADITGLDGDARVLARAQAKAMRAGRAIRFDRALSYEMPYEDASFDRVLSSLFFHHLGLDGKQQTFSEVLRVLRPGGELHVADWGRAANPLMRLAFYGIQLLDGFPNTADNVRGRLPELMAGAGFKDVRETGRFSTMWGTLSLYRATRPAS